MVRQSRQESLVPVREHPSQHLGARIGRHQAAEEEGERVRDQGALLAHLNLHQQILREFDDVMRMLLLMSRHQADLLPMIAVPLLRTDFLIFIKDVVVAFAALHRDRTQGQHGAHVETVGLRRDNDVGRGYLTHCQTVNP